jgi:type I restriction enzyme, S subunit
VKAGWETKPLGDVCTLQRGFDLPTQNRKEGTFPLVSSSGVIDAHIEGPVSSPGVVTGRSGSIGNVFYIEEDFWPLNTTLYVRDFWGNDPRFVFHLLNSIDLKSYAGGTGVPTLNRNDVHQVLVKVPTDIKEQRRIVTLLDEAFADIATAKANAEKNLQNARELFESQLQAIFSGRGTNWEDKTLEQISTTFGRGKSRHRPRNDPALYGGKYPFVQTGDVRNAEHIITEFSQTYSEAGLAQSKLWPKGTICITIAANIAETGILGFDACFPDSVIGVVPNPNEAEVGYVEYVLQSFKARLQALGQGSAQANINMGTFENERFPFPKVEEQRRIVAKLDALSEESQRLESIYRQKLTALDDLKKSLLHQAFSGQL